MADDNFFKKRAGTTDLGKDYENVFMANITLDLILDEDIKDFKQSSNNANFGAFDDVVLETESVNGHKQNYALQLKHSVRPLTANNLAEKKGDFGIKKYLEDFIKLKNDATNNILNFDTYKWIIFTNREFDIKDGTKIKIDGEDLDIEILKCQPEPVLKSICRNGHCYRLKANTEGIRKEYQEFFDKFFLYTNQFNVHQMKETVSNKFQQTFCCKGSIVTEYLKFIDNWSIREGKKHKLNKTLMKHAVAIHLLSPFVQSISCVTSSDKANPRSKLLREAICKFDVSIFNEQNCHRIIQVWTEIKNEFKKVDIQQINKTRSMFQITSNYTKDVEDLNDEECCKLMWLMNMCPLIVSGNKCVVKAINLCENKRFIVLGDGSFTENLHGASVFRNLFDLKVEQNLHDKILKTFKCSLQGKEKIILKELIGQSDETENIVTTNELILMLDDSYVIGGGKEDLPESYIERSLSRHIIDDVFLEKADKNTAIIITSSKKINLNSNCYNLIQIEEFLNEKNLEENKEITKKNIYISKDNCSQEKFKTLCQKIPNMKKYHQFKIVEHNKLEWIRSNGGISDLQKFKTKDCFESEEKLFSSENNDYKTNIVCENPGMGKSTFMKNVKNKDLPSFWTVLLCPKDHSKYFRGKCCDIDKFKKYIQSKISKSPRSFESKLLKILFKENRVSYMWDGLDETSEDNLQIVLNVIEGFAKKGLRQWITSRNNLKTSLEDKFQVFSRTIKEFNEEEQKRYIKKRLTCSEIELEDVFKKIKNNTQQFKKSEILGNPLQIYMFTELFRQDPEKYNHLLENVFSLTDLYSYFIDEKFNFYYRDKENINELNENIIKRNELYKKGRIDNYAKAAMKTYFDHNVLKNLNTNCEELLAEIKKSGDPVGIITDVSEQNISNFVHNSYGEYFAALYLSKNMNMMSQFSNFIFDESCKNIRFLFDSILAQGDQALNAALYQNLSVLRSCTQFQLKHKDIGGRNALHLVCSYGQNYPHKKAKRRGIFNTVYIVNSSSFHNDDYVNKFQQENPDYKSVFEYLLNNECNPYEKDKIFNLNVFEYADKAHCLLPLLMPLSGHKNSFQNIKNFSVPVILHYAAVFNFPTVFDMVGSKNIPLIYNADDESLLVIAARNNSLGTLKKLIDTKNYKTIFKKKQELLINLSCQEGHYEIVKLLIERGASIDSENEYGNRPLHLSCQEGHYKIVKLLIEHGASVDCENKYGNRPLYLAYGQGHYEIVKLLIEHGASVDSENKYGNRPLHLAYGQGHYEIVKLLIERGASVDSENEYGNRLLHLSCQEGHYKIVKLLIERGASVDSENKHGNRPLHLAYVRRHYEIVKLLIERGASVDSENKYGNRLLHLSCQEGHYKIVKLLIERGASVDSENKYGNRPLHLAYGQGHYEIVKLLIERGASVDSENEYGNTLLHLACINGHYEFVKLLIERGESVDSENEYGNRLLHLACIKGHYEIVNLLIERGASVDSENKHGNRPLHLAYVRRHYEIVKLLIERGASVDSENEYGNGLLHLSCQEGHYKIVKLLIERGASVDSENKYGNRPLHLAYGQGHYEIVKLLIERGASVDSENEYGNTLLHLACINGHYEIVKLLIDRGANVDSENKYGNTPLHLAYIRGHYEIVKLLIERGASVDFKNKDGRESLYYEKLKLYTNRARNEVIIR